MSVEKAVEPSEQSEWLSKIINQLLLPDTISSRELEECLKFIINLTYKSFNDEPSQHIFDVKQNIFTEFSPQN